MMLEVSSTLAVPTAWIRFLRTHTELTERMDRRLRDGHGISFREYEVLLALAATPDGRLRRVDLAAKVLLTQSGVTRLLAKLERDGLVGRAASEKDGRVAFAALTADGRRRLAQAQRTHHADIAALFTERLSARDLAALDRALARLPGGAGESAWRA